MGWDTFLWCSAPSLILVSLHNHANLLPSQDADDGNVGEEVFLLSVFKIPNTKIDGFTLNQFSWVEKGMKYCPVKILLKVSNQNNVNLWCAHLCMFLKAKPGSESKQNPDLNHQGQSLQFQCTATLRKLWKPHSEKFLIFEIQLRLIFTNQLRDSA